MEEKGCTYHRFRVTSPDGRTNAASATENENPIKAVPSSTLPRDECRFDSGGYNVTDMGARRLVPWSLSSEENA